MQCMFSLQITKDEFFAEVLRDILLYVSRDLSDKVKICQIFVIAVLYTGTINCIA